MPAQQQALSLGAIKTKNSKVEDFIRKTLKEDLDGLKRVLNTSGLFPLEYLEDMISDYFTNPDTEAIWFTCITDGKPSALGYCAPEKLTNGTYNLYAIAVDKELQGRGIGHKMMNFIEQLLIAKNKRILLVETSGDEHYRLTRKFYQKLNYKQEAVIHDFWNEGEHKIVFLKKLN